MIVGVPVTSEELHEFETHRTRLFGIAYRMLGSAGEAEDAVQDAFLRWNDAERGAVREPAAWLTTVLTNLCLNRLTSARARRESYVGPWLPEPVITEDSALGPLDTVEQRESVSMAFLVLLERLTPPERAVFVLREAFQYGHREIAGVLGVTEANCQQLYHRARERVARDRPRFEAAPEEGRRIAQRFLEAAQGQDVAGLASMLAADVVSWSDGGGKANAARRPVLGSDRVARLLVGWMRKGGPGTRTVVAEINGQPAILGSIAEQLVMAVVLHVVDGRVEALHTVVNPDKLAFLSAQLA
ncbi:MULTISPECIES: RNA polymerase sigma-70 factor [Actinoalloteichus]|uniref:RNA polymerase sigma-70 factor, TIGR02957 family n=1 Tax=Actinoalloteichus fjordicus TaxID=1612552 RepID=A0AAC9PRK4_9PSEU|nr:MULTISPECIES: RNA polymerase sigma-70 factor [Actinoalloteichus]APU14047.1 RNA polymerase sigma-70 factor, TIGR02957 family [Actinoalloteichus fjordicus]APU19993.1 RNA polymerase sigma-70 factor, TIGR02957 family [Actinoalloteichus sp. GBA129-24]